MKLSRTLVLSLAAIFACASAGYAQVATTGVVDVVVTDADGRVVPGATVTVSAPDTVTSRTAVTDGEGRARIEGLQPSPNYNVRVELAGFRTFQQERVLVRSGQTTTLTPEMAVGNLTEVVQVTAGTPVVDVTSATTGMDITLELTESLPTGRSYQSYLQLVPGVMPDNPTSGSGNPAARSGMNYADVALVLGDNVGVSADNAFYFDGINVTDPVRGTFGANLNTEIIQEQKVITGAIPAEYVGVPGLISNVITKSGSNNFTGSGTYFFQNGNLVSENEHGPNEEFSTGDAAFTVGGPIFRDRAWFYGSYRYLTRDDDVSALDTGEFLRSVERTDKQGFLKATYGFTSSDVVSFTWLSDPTDISGRRERNVTNAQDRAREQGGQRYAGNYTRVWGNTLLEVAGNAHNAEISDFSVLREPENLVNYRGADFRTLDQESLGGFGRDLPEDRNTRQVRASATHTFNRHTLKGGVEWGKHINIQDDQYLGDPPARWSSIAAQYGAVPSLDIAEESWANLEFDVTNSSDFGGLIDQINTLPNRASFYALLDTNGDGVITTLEAGSSLVFNSTAGNPHGMINYQRTLQATSGEKELSSRGLSFFAQDEFRLDRWTFNLGVRTEQWKHFASDGSNIYTFEWDWAPRLSAVYDIMGDGRQRASAFWGRYYDPVRNNMTDFAGSVTGSILEEQVFVNNQWVTYRTRGGAEQPDAFFAPTTQTPYTDDLTLGYAIDLGNNQSFEAVYFNRRTRDILEDYDLHLYADPTGYLSRTGEQGDINDPDTLFLGLDYFGYDEVPISNFVIATLAGGKRNFHGLEFVYRKRLSDRWQGQVSYNWNDAKGNTNSDSNADFQGDVLFLDPRAPNQYDTQPGLIRHLVKLGGSYELPMGLQFGAGMSWNSGVHTSRTFRASDRNLPIRITPAEAYEFGGVTQLWIRENAVGSFENPAYATFDLRAQYRRQIAMVNAEFFFDLFNVFDAQSEIQLNDLEAGLGTVLFGDAVTWVLPRRAFFGARVRF